MSGYERRPVPGYEGWEADTEGKVYKNGVERSGWPVPDDVQPAWLIGEL